MVTDQGMGQNVHLSPDEMSEGQVVGGMSTSSPSQQEMWSEDMETGGDEGGDWMSLEGERDLILDTTPTTRRDRSPFAARCSPRKPAVLGKFIDMTQMRKHMHNLRKVKPIATLIPEVTSWLQAPYAPFVHKWRTIGIDSFHLVSVMQWLDAIRWERRLVEDRIGWVRFFIGNSQTQYEDRRILAWDNVCCLS